MQNILFILNAPPYGSERCLTALRLASALATDPTVQLTLFLVSDAVLVAQAKQQVAAGLSLGQMLEDLIAEGAHVVGCRTCLDTRGISTAQLLPGVRIGTMPELAQLTLEADKVLSF